uniref:Sushi domain-containing protein n=1 Tax=Varanus komodoensis TaxID=61221 RepID=A0A8D2L6W2_VARKO
MCPVTAVICPALHKPDHGRFSCLHPHGNFAYGSSCNFSCSGGFQLAGPERLECTARGDWTKKQPRCEGSVPGPAGALSVRCPALEDPAHGRSACSHPYGHFAYRSSCVFSCRSGFELLGPEMLNCTDQGNWTGTVPTCEAMKCLQLKQGENMKLRCSSPWAPFSYGSACEFSCPEGYVLNGTKQMQCQADGSWSAAMPLCQGTPVGFQRRALQMERGTFSFKSSAASFLII